MVKEQLHYPLLPYPFLSFKNPRSALLSYLDELQNPVKPPSRKSPRQSSTFAWRSSFTQTHIIDTASEKASESIRGLFYFPQLLQKDEFTHNSFVWTNLPVTLLFGRI
jgi:hypothetical protein